MVQVVDIPLLAPPLVVELPPAILQFPSLREMGDRLPELSERFTHYGLCVSCHRGAPDILLAVPRGYRGEERCVDEVGCKAYTSGRLRAAGVRPRRTPRWLLRRMGLLQ